MPLCTKQRWEAAVWEEKGGSDGQWDTLEEITPRSRQAEGSGLRSGQA